MWPCDDFEFSVSLKLPMDEEIIKEYKNDDITVVWKPARCIHSRICWQTATGLPLVFNPRIKPWINMQQGNTDEIVAQVKKCPSAALSFFYNNKEKENSGAAPATATQVEILPDGPLLVSGDLFIKDSQGNITRRQDVTAFCRCGQSANKPYCDGAHTAAGFKG